MKKSIQIVIATALLLLLFGGPIFRMLITYHEIGSRPIIELTNQKLIQTIENGSIDIPLSIDAIVDIANEITTSQLSFTTSNASRDPNVLASSKKANCIGYAAMFNSVASYIVKQKGLQKDIEVQHKIGELDFLGFDLHQFSDNPFFKDHDFNIIINKTTNEKIAVDASLSDYLWVDRVNSVR